MDYEFGNTTRNTQEITDVENCLNTELLTYFEGEKDGFVQVGPKKWLYPKKYRELAEDYKNFKVRADDVWIMGFPRSGTTITQELAWLLRNDLDFERAKINVNERVRYFEASLIHNEKRARERLVTRPQDKENTLSRMNIVRNQLKSLNDFEKPRVIKTHLPFELLPSDICKKCCKVIYVCRHPKDVAVSFFFLESQGWHTGYVGDFKRYWKYFKNGHCAFGPYFEHVKQAIEKQKFSNVLFIFYEEMRQNLPEFIIKISEFLERPLSFEEMEKLENHLNFDSFKKNPAIAIRKGSDKNEDIQFVRKGEIGGWTEFFTEEMCREADEWIERETKEIGIVYPGHV